jgi:hypothetical protein
MQVENELRLASGLTALGEEAGLSQRDLANRIGVSPRRSDSALSALIRRMMLRACGRSRVTTAGQPGSFGLDSRG